LTMAKARVTVFIPTFNRLSLLRRAVDSVLANSSHTSLHVLDNASTDGTPEWLKQLQAEHHSRVQLTLHPSNTGASNNFRLGFYSVRTEFLVPLADDDELVPGFVDLALPLLDTHPDACAVIGQLASTGGPSHATVAVTEGRSALWERREPSEHIRSFLRNGHYVSWSAAVWRTAFVHDHNVVDKSLIYRLLSDVHFQFYLFTRYPAILLHAPAATFAVSDSQASAAIGRTAESITDLGHLATRMEATLVSQGIAAPEESRALVACTVRRWARYIARNRARGEIVSEHDTIPAMIAYLQHLAPYIGLADFPFVLNALQFQPCGRSWITRGLRAVRHRLRRAFGF